MEKSVIKVLFLQLILIGYGVGVRGVDQDEKILQEQPYRSAFHFQPPKNWMNGEKSKHIFLLIYSPFIATVILILWDFFFLLFFFLGIFVGGMILCLRAVKIQMVKFLLNFLLSFFIFIFIFAYCLY